MDRVHELYEAMQLCQDQFRYALVSFLSLGLHFGQRRGNGS